MALSDAERAAAARLRRRNNPERSRDIDRKYRETHRDQLRKAAAERYKAHGRTRDTQYEAAYREKHRDRLRAYHEQWRKANTALVRAQQKQWREDNADRERVRCRAKNRQLDQQIRLWRERNRDKVRASSRKAARRYYYKYLHGRTRNDNMPESVKELRRALLDFKRWMKANGYTLRSLSQMASP